MEQYSYKDLRRMSPGQLIKLRVKYAKRANQRLVRLERSESPVTGKPYSAGAYDIAMEYLKNTREKQTKEGSYRFSESPNYTKHIDAETGKTAYDMYRIKRDILELQSFLASKSSTVSGNKKIERKRIETFKREGISETTAASSEFYDFLNSNAYEYFVLNDFTSETIVDIYNNFREAGMDGQRIQKAFDDLKAKALRNAKKNKELAGDGITVKDINKALKKKMTKKELATLAKNKKGVLF